MHYKAFYTLKLLIDTVQANNNILARVNPASLLINLILTFGLFKIRKFSTISRKILFWADAVIKNIYYPHNGRILIRNVLLIS